MTTKLSNRQYTSPEAYNIIWRRDKIFSSVIDKVIVDEMLPLWYRKHWVRDIER